MKRSAFIVLMFLFYSPLPSLAQSSFQSLPPAVAQAIMSGSSEAIRDAIAAEAGNDPARTMEIARQALEAVRDEPGLADFALGPTLGAALDIFGGVGQESAYDQQESLRQSIFSVVDSGALGSQMFVMPTSSSWVGLLLSTGSQPATSAAAMARAEFLMSMAEHAPSGDQIALAKEAFSLMSHDVMQAFPARAGDLAVAGAEIAARIGTGSLGMELAQSALRIAQDPAVKAARPGAEADVRRIAGHLIQETRYQPDYNYSPLLIEENPNQDASPT